MKPVLLRIASLLAVLVIVTLAISFMVDQLPGDPARAILGEDATPAQIEILRQQLRLDDPFLTRYFSWLGGVLTGDFGASIRTQEDVAQAILARAPVSIQLMIMAQIFAIALAIPLAVFSAYRPRTVLDRTSAGFAFASISVAPFVTALILILVFAVWWQLLPPSGYTPLTSGLWENIRSMILPSIALALVPFGVYQRILRSDMGNTLGEDFILAARAKGMPPRNLMWRQALRPSSLGFLTLAGLNTASLIGGSIVIETIFALPGLGQLMTLSISSRDIVVMQSLVFLIAVVYILINLSIDLLYRFVDPRVAHAR